MLNDINQHTENGMEYVESYMPYPRLKAVTAAEFISMELPARNVLLEPWLPEQGLTMVYAPRGIGKTFFALNVAYAIASGGSFLCWKASAPRKVLYIDGEMPAKTMQERLKDIITTHQAEAPEDGLVLLTPDLQQDVFMPNLATIIGQDTIEPHLQGVSLVVIDNISTLCHSGVENDAESWVPIQEWVLKLRSRGISVLFVHHAGKGGNQRGTSKREDVLDTVISLRRPPNYSAEDGAHFEIHFEKSRGFCGSDAQPIDCKLTTDANKLPVWTWQLLENSTYQRVIELTQEKIKPTEIARELNLNRSTVSRHIKRAKSEGKLL